MSMNKKEINDLKNTYLGKQLHIITNSIDRWGLCEYIDANGFLYGSWGSFKIDPKKDYISLRD